MTNQSLNKRIENIDRNLEELAYLKSVNMQYKAVRELDMIHRVKRFIYLDCLRAKGSVCDHVQAASAQFGLSEAEITTLMAYFDTYIGTTSDLCSRLDLSYLVDICPVVQMGCLAAVRRADYLMENGLTTSVAVSRYSICIPVYHPLSGEVFASDISSWFSTPISFILAATGGDRFTPVDIPGDERMEYLDNLITDVSILKFMNHELAPRYTKPDRWYYDPLADCPDEFHGYKISYIESSDDHLFPCF